MKKSHYLLIFTSKPKKEHMKGESFENPEAFLKLSSCLFFT